MGEVTASAAAREDAESVLYWLLTSHPGALYAAAFRAAYGDAGRTAALANAGREWREACADLASLAFNPITERSGS